MDPISIREKWFGRLEQVRTERLSGGVPLLYFPDPEWTDLPELYSECGRPFATTVGDARTRLAVYKKVLRRERGLLLFGMAAAAYEAGTGNRLWPEVRKRFLAAYPRSTITLAQFQALAAIFTECWEAEVRDSRGRLFVPRQGLRNIKWPLSHAGLKPAEREDLVDFARAVAIQFGADGLQSFLDADTQEFTMMLKDWLRAGTGHIGARLRELIEDVRFPIVAELGRAFLLRRGVASFRDRAVVGQVVPDSTAQLIRRQLVFDADARQLRIRLSGGNFPNTGPLTMNWEGSEHRLHARTANVGSRLARRLDTDVVVATIWKRDDARIMYTGGSSLVTLPPSPDKSAFLWFSESSGLQSRTWQEGQVYSAVRNPDRPSTWPALLFSTKHPWRPLELLGAKLEFGHVTARPLAEIMREVGDLGVLLGRLEAEGAEIDFGSLRSGSEPHATLTSGMPVEYLGNEAILVEEPPMVEIRGDWTGRLSVTLRSETFTETVTVTKPSDGVALLTLVDPRPGTLEVTVRDRRLPIQLLGGWPRPTRPPAILSVRRTVVGDATVIDGQAWPGADITVFH